jgi:hypothetical protein
VIFKDAEAAMAEWRGRGMTEITIGSQTITVPDLDEATAVKVQYVNHRGEVGTLRIIPLSIRYGETPRHQGRQWLLNAWDCDRQEQRTLAMLGIEAWGIE